MVQERIPSLTVTLDSTNCKPKLEPIDCELESIVLRQRRFVRCQHRLDAKGAFAMLNKPPLLSYEEAAIKADGPISFGPTR